MVVEITILTEVKKPKDESHPDTETGVEKMYLLL